MKGFVFVYQKVKLKHRIREIISTINSLKNTKHQFEQINSDNLISINYGNEPSFIEDNFANSKHIATIGQFVESRNEILMNISSLSSPEIISYVKNLRGAFALGVADYENYSMEFFTHIFRIDNIFYIENENEIVVGTDPLIVSAISNENLEPQIDIDNSISFLMNGFFADEKTLFKDVQLMPPNSVMKVDSSGINIKAIDNSYNEMFTKNPSKELNEQIKENYIEAFKAVPRDATINIGITGGKDSRLALLGLLEADYNVKTNTRGFLDNPDVQMAEKLTKKLGLEHKIVEPKILDRKGMNVNIEKKALQSMIATSGQVYGYENIQYQPNYKGNIGVTGVAALTMKGGYSNLNNVSPKSAFEEMIKRFLPLENLLVKGKTEEYRATIKELGTEDFQEAQFKHAMFYRNGRWTSGTRLAKAYSSDMYSPYYDNQFTKSIMKIKKRFLDNGFTQYTLMNKLNKEISLFPLVGSRWGFEKDQPAKAENYNGWINRTPIYPKTKLANYNWRNLTLPDNTIIRDEFENVLLSDSNHIIYEVVDYNKLKELFFTKLTSRHLKFMWALLSLYAYINYLNGLPITSKNLNITIPETVINETTNTPETIDLTNEIYSTNKDVVILSSTRKSTIKRKTNNHVDKNIYLTTFNTNISSPSISQKSLVSNRKEISFNIHLKSIKEIYIKYCVIFFNNQNEKIEANWFEAILNTTAKNIIGKSLIPKSAKSYKIAFKLPNSFKEEIVVNYFFSTIK